MYRVSWKVGQSFQLLILHQMSPYFSVWPLCGSNDTCFTLTQVLGNLGKLGWNTPNHTQGHMKSNPQSSYKQPDLVWGCFVKVFHKTTTCSRGPRLSGQRVVVLYRFDCTINSIFHSDIISANNRC